MIDYSSFALDRAGAVPAREPPAPWADQHRRAAQLSSKRRTLEYVARVAAGEGDAHEHAQTSADDDAAAAPATIHQQNVDEIWRLAEFFE